jgi:hypothetical protein
MTFYLDHRIKRIEGRKIFVEAELGDQPLITPAAEAPGDRDGTATGHSPAQTPGKVYAKGNALFIIPRQVSRVCCTLAAVQHGRSQCNTSQWQSQTNVQFPLLHVDQCAGWHQ